MKYTCIATKHEQLVGWVLLVGWLVGWLVGLGWLGWVGWLVGWLVG
jgi:hypothetical protein